MKPSNVVCVLLAALFINACGSSKPPAAPATEIAAAPTVPTAPKPKACDLISIEQMTQLLGAAVVATADEGGGRTACNWAPAGGGMPYAELKLEWGMAEAAMQAASMLARVEPGINDPYDDLGEEAWVTGPAVMVKRGEDLFTLMVYGTQDAEATIHKMYQTAVSRL